MPECRTTRRHAAERDLPKRQPSRDREEQRDRRDLSQQQEQQQVKRKQESGETSCQRSRIARGVLQLIPTQCATRDGGEQWHATARSMIAKASRDRDKERFEARREYYQ